MNRLERWEYILKSCAGAGGQTSLLQIAVDLHMALIGSRDSSDDEMDRMVKALCARLEDWTDDDSRTALFDGAVKQVVLAVIAEYREHRLRTEQDRGTVAMNADKPYTGQLPSISFFDPS